MTRPSASPTLEWCAGRNCTELVDRRRAVKASTIDPHRGYLCPKCAETRKNGLLR